MQENVQLNVTVHIRRGVFWSRLIISLIFLIVTSILLWFRKAVPGFRRTKGGDKALIQSDCEEFVNKQLDCAVQQRNENHQIFYKRRQRKSPQIRKTERLSKKKFKSMSSLLQSDSKELIQTQKFVDQDKEESDFSEDFIEYSDEIEDEEVDEVYKDDDDRRYDLIYSCFVGISSKILLEIAREFEWVHVKKGEVLFESGQTDDLGMFIVVRGRIGVYKKLSDKTFLNANISQESLQNKEEKLILLSCFTKNQNFGELSLLSDKIYRERYYTCRALCDTDLLRLPRQKFHKSIVAKYPQLLVLFVESTLARKQRAANLALYDFFQINRPKNNFGFYELDGMNMNILSKDSNVKENFESNENGNEDLVLGIGQKIDETLIGKRVFVLISGKLCLYSKDGEDSLELEPGSIIGAMSYFSGGCRICNQYGRALMDCKLCIFSRNDFVIRPKALALKIVRTVIEIMLPAIATFVGEGFQIVRKKAGSILYSPGDRVNRLYLVIYGRVRAYSQSVGSTNKQEPGHHFFEVGRGECVGEMSMLTGKQRHFSTVICSRDTELASLSTVAFDILRSMYPQVLSRVSRVLSLRLASVLNKSSRRLRDVSTITLIKIGQNVDLDRFALLLTNSLKKFGGNVSYLNYERASKLLNDQMSFRSLSSIIGYSNLASDSDVQKNNNIEDLDGNNDKFSKEKTDLFGCSSFDLFCSSTYSSKLALLMMELESSNRFVIMQCDTSASSWSRYCVRQADIVFVVGNANEAPEVYPIEQSLLCNNSDFDQSIDDLIDKRQSSSAYIDDDFRSFDSLRCIELVLIHSNQTLLPSGTKNWLDNRRKMIHTYHHIRETDQNAYDRLARSINGTTVGLVLGGGGARGLAHFGVLRALEDKNIPIDFVCGTSHGSFMAALFAIYESSKAMEKPTREISAQLGNVWSLISDATFPIMSYFSGLGFNSILTKIFDSKICIEDLQIPYFCVTTNVSQADISVHRSGILQKAVRSSMTILDYLPPMQNNGDMYIDGGYINNLPVDIMKEVFDPELVIAVDVENKDESLKNVSDYGDYLSGFQLLFHRLQCFFNPFAKRLHLPKFAEIVGSLSYMNHNRNIRRFINEQMMDIYIRPELGDVKLLDYHKFDLIQTIGFKYTYWKLNEQLLNNEDRFWVTKYLASIYKQQNRAQRILRRTFSQNEFQNFEDNTQRKTRSRRNSLSSSCENFENKINECENIDPSFDNTNNEIDEIAKFSE